ncbi:ALK tyrosine kinase receptor-like [Stomoxys calcitrans]|uniref:ALK tyrosine kinase receptor-like n=1 Tax=Stomoxys calcitrans TaxID=35570 RepID=UPI0027E344EE|nr:ALK tyrosine kinase receptor-like [Stomoxys calcitrans]
MMLYNDKFENESAHVLMHNATVVSPTFNPPPLVHGDVLSPYRNSCSVKFFAACLVNDAFVLTFSVVEIQESTNITTVLYNSYKDGFANGLQIVTLLPNITSRYFLQLVGHYSRDFFSMSIYNLSLSSECFGINIPREHLKGYHYWNVWQIGAPHKDFENYKYLELGTCFSQGRHGPTQHQCTNFYKKNNRTHVLKEVRVVTKYPYEGMQKWKVPRTGFCTFIVKGAGGGFAFTVGGTSRGAVVFTILELYKDEEIYLLIGQQGRNGSHTTTKEDGDISTMATAGGGGGGSFVFKRNSFQNDIVLLVAAGGGGGLGIGEVHRDGEFQHGHSANFERQPTTGQIYGGQQLNASAGPGGGIKVNLKGVVNGQYGDALLSGGRGGMPCHFPQETLGPGISHNGEGGFGGGGGGCNTGGGGGGYSGGDVYSNRSHGKGGYSYINHSRALTELSAFYAGSNLGDGSITIIPDIEGCGCDYRCLAMDEHRSSVMCICPHGSILANNSKACIDMRCQRNKLENNINPMAVDIELTKLRQNIDGSYLSNYSCIEVSYGEICINSLPQVDRRNLKLVKVLGKGAFGEVYQGSYRYDVSGAAEKLVAVKILAKGSTELDEIDFVMEAAIMAKFDHPNIVQLIGVCFNSRPSIVVLELLAGGDLKHFLTQVRHQTDRSYSLAMIDLVFCALDVAKGCHYLECQHFIHRDIAARNCLLSSDGSERKVKIADFGLARDIYRCDYYRKDGNTLLPIKWMPPEAFLDNIFTSKTDVWSFGVLLWEIFSVGLVPYAGLQNREIIQLVTKGGKLDAPPACPSIIYEIMVDCWSIVPDDRPTFLSILERLEAAVMNPAVMNCTLPHLFPLPSKLPITNDSLPESLEKSAAILNISTTHGLYNTNKHHWYVNNEMISHSTSE